MVGTSADGLLLVVFVRDEMEETEEDVWVLCGGGGVENVSVLRSGSKGELDGEGEGMWMFINSVLCSSAIVLYRRWWDRFNLNLSAF